MLWKSVCCALQGRGHIKNNIPCQDKVAKLEKNGVHVIVLADGAGSAAFSHFGAERVVNCVADFIVANFLDLIENKEAIAVKQELLRIILDELKIESELRKCTIKDLTSTLLVAAVTDEKFFLAHLGDGVLGYLNEDGLKVVSIPDNGEFANETVFVTSESAISHLRIYKGNLKNICGFVLMSDGTEQSLYNKRNKTLAPVVKKLMHRTCLIDSNILTPQLEEAINSVVVENTQDDCSIALLARISEQLPPLENLSLQEKQEIFKMPESSYPRKNRKKIYRYYENICNMLKKPLNLRQISRKLHLKKKYVKKKLQPLIDAGVIIKNDNIFKIYS